MNSEGTVTLTVNETTMEKMKSFYDSLQAPNGKGALYSCIKCEGVTVSLYAKNKKGEYKALFQGKNALSEAQIWDKDAKVVPLKKKEEKENALAINRFPQIGSDEVGTGDFFGPIIVVAAFVRKENVPVLKKLGITDSKKMSDDRILELGPSLIHQYDYSELSLDNRKYNDEVNRKYNMNEIKARMHNRALLNLKKKHPSAYAYQDQFAVESLYYSYLRNEKEVLRDISFKTKGESAFISVALASVIARYAFLRKMAKMSDDYGVKFPFGAGEEVDRFIISFLKAHDKKELRDVAKLNFANYRKLIQDD